MYALSVFVSLATMTLAFSSCQPKNQPDDQTPSKPEEPTIVGNWEVVTMDMVSDTGHGTTSTETYPGQGLRLVFAKDNSCTIYDGAGIQQGTYSVSGTNLTVVINEPFNEVQRYTIQELTASTLVLKLPQNEGEAIVFHCKRS